ARLAQRPADVDTVDEVVLTGGVADEVDRLALLRRDVDVAPADCDPLQQLLGAALVPGAVAPLERPGGGVPLSREGRLVVARQAEAALVVAHDLRPVQRPQ